MQAGGADWAQLIKQARQHQRSAAVTEAPVVHVVSFCFGGGRYGPMLQSLAYSAMYAVRQDGSINAGLTAAGYNMGPLRQGFEALAYCYPQVLQTDRDHDVAAGNVAGLISALEAAGRACDVFAVPHCCNNPGCSNLAGGSELSIVSGKGCICGGCQVARYCGRGCQKAHLKQHKPVCKMLQTTTAQHS
jgi:hypothetical protein